MALQSNTTCSEYSPLPYDETFLSWWEWLFPGWHYPPSESVMFMGLALKIMWIISFGLCIQQTSVQLNAYGRSLYYRCYHQEEDVSFGRIVLHHCSRVPETLRINVNMHRSSFCSMWWLNILFKTHMFFAPYNLLLVTSRWVRKQKRKCLSSDNFRWSEQLFFFVAFALLQDLCSAHG